MSSAVINNGLRLAHSRLFRSIVVVYSLLLGLIFNSGAQTTREYQLKAAFLFNFTQFVDWPASSIPSTNSPIVIGILGIDPFGKTLDQIVQNESVGGRKLVVERYSSLSQIQNCHILYISPSESEQMEAILGKLKGSGILTVGDTDNFARRGGVIGFYIDKNKIRLRVNLESAREEKLSLSSKLLRLAEIVREQK